MGRKLIEAFEAIDNGDPFMACDESKVRDLEDKYDELETKVETKDLTLKALRYKYADLEEKAKKIIQEYADLLHDSECLYEQCENKTHMRASVKEYYHAENEFLTAIKGDQQ